MRQAFNFYTKFLSPSEKLTYIALLCGRSLVGLLDVIGVLSVGYLATSVASFVVDGSNVGKTLSFAGISLPAVTAKNLPFIAFLIIAIFLAKAMLAIYFTKVMAVKIAIIEARAAKALSENALGGNLERKTIFKPEEISFAVQIGTSSAFTAILNAFASLISEGFLFLALSIAFVIFNPLATLCMLTYFALLAFLINLFIGKKLSKASKEAYEKTVEANKLLNDVMTAFREVSVAGSRDFFFDGIYNSRKSASKNLGRQTYLAGMPRHVIETGLVIGIGLFIFVQSSATNLSEAAATVGIFLAGGFRIVAAMLPWQNALVIIKMNIPQSQTTWALLEMSLKMPNKPKAIEYSQQRPVAVTARDLYYSYPDGSDVISGLTFSIEAGSNVAIIGPSGAGKSTLADLILGLLSPKSGELKIDGENAEIFISLKPGIASYVPQNPGIISGSLKDNVTLSRRGEEVCQSNLEYALISSNLQGVVAKLEKGIDTVLASQDSEVSGGQRQRIGLARALYTRPGLLLLDEATSALDAETEDEVVKTILDLKGQVTVITIAHRLNSVKNADVIFYMDGGRILASGTLAELQKSNQNVANAIRLLSI